MDANAEGYSAVKRNYDEYDYSNDSDLPDETCNMDKFGVITPVFFPVVVFFSLLCNILVMVLVAKYENHRSLTNMLILNLAVSDLIFTFGLPFWAYYHTHGWTLGQATCKIVSFIFYMGFYTNGIVLILMTVHRYVSVVRPLSDLLTSGDLVGVLASVLIWTLGPLAALPALIFSQAQDDMCEYADEYWKTFGIYQQNAMFLVNIGIFCFCYTQILCRLVRSPAQRRRHRTLKLICTLVLVFFMGWAPYNFLIFLQTVVQVDKDCQIYKTWGYAFYLSRLMAYSHCCLNPVFYVFVGIKFKNHLKRMLRCQGMQRRRISSTLSRLTSGEEFSA